MTQIPMQKLKYGQFVPLIAIIMSSIHNLQLDLNQCIPITKIKLNDENIKIKQGEVQVGQSE